PAPTLEADESLKRRIPLGPYSRPIRFRGYDKVTMTAMEEAIKDFAKTLGFPLCGIAPATAADGFDRLTDWLDRGYAGEMKYMQRHHSARQHPGSILANVRSVIMVGMEYSAANNFKSSDAVHAPIRSSTGLVARYAAGPDYHEVMWRKLDKLIAWLQ